MDTAQEKEERRASVESTYSNQRDQLEKSFIADKEALEAAYHADIKANEQDRRDALVAAGLNPDGSDPQGR